MPELSDHLADLSARVKRSEETLRAVREQDRKKLESQRTQLKASAAVLSKIGKQQATDVQHELDNGWASARESLTAPFAKMHSRVDKRHAEHDVERARKQADVAELDAVNAIDLALYCLEQADYAIIYAVSARTDADKLTSS